jgi:hypothetical protein
MVGLQVLFMQDVQRGAVLTMVGLQVLFMQGVQRGAVLTMVGLQVLFMEVTNNIQTFLKSVYHEAAKITCRIKQLEYF